MMVYLHLHVEWAAIVTAKRLVRYGNHFHVVAGLPSKFPAREWTKYRCVITENKEEAPGAVIGFSRWGRGVEGFTGSDMEVHKIQVEFSKL